MNSERLAGLGLYPAVTPRVEVSIPRVELVETAILEDVGFDTPFGLLNRRSGYWAAQPTFEVRPAQPAFAGKRPDWGDR